MNPDATEKDQFWKVIYSLNMDFGCPSVILRDFNDFLLASENRGANLLTLAAVCC